MNLEMIKHYLRRAAAFAVVLCLGISPAAAYDAGEPVAAIAPVSSSSSAQGTVLSARQVDTAAAAAEQAAAEQEAKEQAAKAAAEQAALRPLLSYQPTYGGTVQYSSAKSASEVITSNGRLLGSYKLTFYCPCTKCSGQWGTGTYSGVRAVEGRTIAVDPNKIPIGSRVFIEGYGDFIAEDVGGAIKGNKIDVYLNSHSRCYDLGVQYANIYIMN